MAPKIELLDCTTDPLYVISFAARTCYNSHNKDDISKRSEFVKGLIKSGHHTPLEFASACFYITGISRTCQNQIVRHRIASYCVLSERYVNVAGLDVLYSANLLSTCDQVLDLTNEIKKMYVKLIQNGVKKEDARAILPQGIETKMCMCMNFRELRHFLKLRLNKHAQDEIRKVATEIYYICQERWPWLVEDITL